MPVVRCSKRALSLLSSPTTTSALLAAAVTLGVAVHGTAAAEATPPEMIEQRVQALVPRLEDYTATNMKAFDVPGLAIGIVAGDKLVYAKGFGVR